MSGTRHIEKADPSILVTEAGIEIDFSEKQPWNASASISATIEIGSNRIDATRSQPQKALRQIRRTQDGTTTLSFRPKQRINDDFLKSSRQSP
jgi:hypothetical protein